MSGRPCRGLIACCVARSAGAAAGRDTVSWRLSRRLGELSEVHRTAPLWRVQCYVITAGKRRLHGVRMATGTVARSGRALAMSDRSHATALMPAARFGVDPI